MRLTKAKLNEFLKSERFKIILLIVIALAVRLYKLSKEVFWIDEGVYISYTFLPSVKSVIQTCNIWTNRPPLYFIIYNAWGKTFGISQKALLLFPVITGVVSIILMYFIVKKLFKNKDIAFIAALLTCFSLYHFHYSRDNTEYMFFPMMIFLSILTFINLMQSTSQTRTKNTILHIISTTALFYTHNYAFMIILIENVTFFAFLKRNRHLLKSWILAQLAILLLIAPQLALTYNQADYYANAFGNGLGINMTIGRYSKSIIEQLMIIYQFNLGDKTTNINHLIGNNSLAQSASKIMTAAVFLLLISGIALSLIEFKKVRKKQSAFPLNLNEENAHGLALLLLLLIVPILITALYSDIIFREKCFVFTILVFNTFLAAGIIRLFQNRKIAKTIIVSGLIIISILSITHSIKNNYFFGEQEDWKAAAEFLKQPEQRAEAIFIDVDYASLSFLYYYNNSLVYDFKLMSGSNQKIILAQADLVNKDLSFKPNMTRINESISKLTDFWMVSSPHTYSFYGGRELFDMIEQGFRNSSSHSFGTVFITRYLRR